MRGEGGLHGDDVYSLGVCSTSGDRRLPHRIAPGTSAAGSSASSAGAATAPEPAAGAGGLRAPVVRGHQRRSRRHRAAGDGEGPGEALRVRRPAIRTTCAVCSPGFGVGASRFAGLSRAQARPVIAWRRPPSPCRGRARRHHRRGAPGADRRRQRTRAQRRVSTTCAALWLLSVQVHDAIQDLRVDAGAPSWWCARPSITWMTWRPKRVMTAA